MFLLYLCKDVDPDEGLFYTRLWLKINTFLLFLDFYSFFIKLNWYIFGIIIVLARIIIIVEVKEYSMHLEIEAAKAADDETESPEQ